MIQLIDVCKDYHVKGAPNVKALDHVNVTFGEKGLVFILGKSGAGKSTMLNVIGGLDRVDSGDIVVMGKSSKDFTQSEFDSYRNTYLGFIFQEYNILNDFTIGQNIALALQLQGQKGDEKAVDEILNEVDLHGLSARKPNQLSGGQKQRVAIARALIKKPEVILADEPTGALDSKTGEEIFNTLKKLAATHLVIVVSHDRDFAESFGDRVIEMKDGRIISDISKTLEAPKSANPNVTLIGESIISIRPGYQLTESDVGVINGYLARADQDAILSIDSKANTSLKNTAKIDEKGEMGVFSNTTPEMVGAKASDGADFHLKKSRLPFARSFKMGASSLKNKPFRLLVTSILILASLTLFGLSATLAGYNSHDAFVQTYKLSPVSASLIMPENSSYYGNGYDVFTEAEAQAIRSESGLPFTGAVSMQRLIYQNYNYSGNNGISINSDTSFYASTTTSDPYIYPRMSLPFMTFYESAESHLSERGDITVEAGRYPTATDEVAVTDYIYQLFARYGYMSQVRDTVTDGSGQVTSTSRLVQYSATDLDTPAKFLAKNLAFNYTLHHNDASDTSIDTAVSLKIVGIVTNGLDFAPFEYLKGKSESQLSSDTQAYYLASSLNTLYQIGPLGTVYGLPGLYDAVSAWRGGSFDRASKIYQALSAPLQTGDLEAYYAFIKKNEIQHSDYTSNAYSYYEPNYGQFSRLDSGVRSMTQYFLYFGLAIAFFAALLLATFIANSIAYKKREIGILRAVGARGADIYGIFLNESLLITLVCSVLACVLTGVLSWHISLTFVSNLHIAFSLFNFGILDLLVILGLAIATAVLASLIPCLIISHKKPIDSINDR
jgi:ABC-type lipoprotein export system ATPase subunit